MNKCTPLIVLLFSVSLLNGQITLTNSRFPKVGDVLKTASSFEVNGNLDMGSTNGPKVWDFSILNRGEKQETKYVLPAEGTDASTFPDATILAIDETGQEAYLNINNTRVEVLGFGGNNGFIEAPVAVRFSKRPILQKAPLEFINSTSSESEFKLDIGTSIIPDTILNLLPIKPDSIRILFSNVSKGLVDAFGTLKIQGSTFDVLREKREDISSTKFLVKVPVLGWFDPTPLLGGGGLPFFGDLLGLDTTIVYNFYSNNKKETIVSAEYNLSNELQMVTFVDLGNVISSTNNEVIVPEVTVYPNPATDYIRIKNQKWTNGKSWLTIADMSGKIVIFDAGTNDADKEINISTLQKGMYVLSIRDQFNKAEKSIKFIVH